jgi:hypothetical protein
MKTSTSFTKGDPRAKLGGRPKGGRAKFDRELGKRMKEKGEITPLDCLLAMMRDEELPPEIRVRAAVGAAPYVHKRKPQALEVTGKFEWLTAEERELRRQLLLEDIRKRAAGRTNNDASPN